MPQRGLRQYSWVLGLQLQKALAKPPAKALLLASWPDAAPCSGHTLSHPCRHRAGGTPATTTRWYWPVSSAAMPPQGHVTKTSPSRERKRGREGQKEGRKEWREGGEGGREEKREGEETEKGRREERKEGSRKQNPASIVTTNNFSHCRQY